MQYIVITPVRNEAKYIVGTIQSMVGQTLRPSRWLIVDDGSHDGTFDILHKASTEHSWISVVRRPDRGFRKSGGGVMEAFYDGYAEVRDEPWDFIVKLDGDLTFAANYFEQCLIRFVADPTLGIGGGTVLVHRRGRLAVDSPGDPPFHVRGATKIYRRACWTQISPLVCAPGWDTIDEVSANMHNWHTRTFRDLTIIQHRETGATDGAWRNGYKNGLANYIAGYHPLFMIGKCVKRAFQRPPLAAAALCAGFCAGYITRLPRAANSDTLRYLRRQQLLRLTARPSIYARSATTELKPSR